MNKAGQDSLSSTDASVSANASKTKPRPAADRKVYNIVHLIYRSRHYEGHSKDYEFSRLTMEDHWRAGYYDAVRTLRHQEVLERPSHLEGVFIFDVAQASLG